MMHLPVGILGGRRERFFLVSGSLKECIDLCDVTASFEKRMGGHSHKQICECAKRTAANERLQKRMFDAGCLHEQFVGGGIGQVQTGHQLSWGQGLDLGGGFNQSARIDLQ